MSKQILVVAAHPDDEVLGCGGIIARHVAEGDNVAAVFMTDGVGSRSSSSDQDAAERKSAADRALAVLGVKSSTAFQFPDNAMDSVPRLEIVKAIESVVEKHVPEVVYTNHADDLNIDHRLVHEAVMTACRPEPGCSVREICSFEVLSATGWSSPSMGAAFVPQKYVEITKYWDLKLQALEAYKEEMRPSPHARSMESVKALAEYRGHQIGVPLAEALVVERLLS